MRLRSQKSCQEGNGALKIEIGVDFSTENIQSMDIFNPVPSMVYKRQQKLRGCIYIHIDIYIIRDVFM